MRAVREQSCGEAYHEADIMINPIRHIDGSVILQTDADYVSPAIYSCHSYRSPKHACRRSEVEWTTFRIRVHPLSDELSILYFVPLHCYTHKLNRPRLELSRANFDKRSTVSEPHGRFTYMILR